MEIPLVQAADLTGFRGAPFPPAVMSGAAESLRTECEWHIAPVIESTVKIRAGGSDTIFLPTLMLTEVVSVTGSDGQVVTGWDELENGVLERAGGFPRFVTVVFKHGFTTCPPELLTIVAERSVSAGSGRISQESLGSRSVSLEAGYDSVSMAVIDKYRLYGRP